MADLSRKRARTELAEESDETSNEVLESILRAARRMWQRDPDVKRATSSEEKDFRSHFGCSPPVCATLWNHLQVTDLSPQGGTLDHLLWALMFLKIYGKQRQMCTLAGGVDQDTFRKWTWLFLNAIVQLEPLVVRICLLISYICLILIILFSLQIIWNNRLKNDQGNGCLISVDGTDFMIQELVKTFIATSLRGLG